MDLAGRVVVVTGAGSGIGRAIALLFEAVGARVVAADVSPDGLAALAREAGRAVETIVVDVSVPEEVERLLALAVQRFGRVDVLCNNAAIMDRMLPVAEVPDEVWQRVLSVNLTGPFLTSRGVLPIMLAQGDGVIVNIASTAGIRGGRAGAAYTVSKHGLIGLTRSIGTSYGDLGIRCVAVCPGAISSSTGSVEGEPSDLGLATSRRTLASRPRCAEPAEIARVVLFLASPEARHLNAATVVVDGGWTEF